MPTQSKLELSPSQALLLLIDKFQSKPDTRSKLERLYLCGVRSPEDLEQFNLFISDPLLKDYEIAFTPKAIDEDASRRYFESHLAYESLRYGLSSINLVDLQHYVETLIKLIPEDFVEYFSHTLEGEIKPFDEQMFIEYADYIQKLKTAAIFEHFSSTERDKIRLLVQATFLGLMVANFKNLPLDIYGTGLYSQDNRGKNSRKLKDGHEVTLTTHLGLMKSNMPLPKDDTLLGQVVFPLLKPSDQAEYEESALWVKKNFDQLMHPFSNSISGTILCQLRTQAELINQNEKIFTQNGESFSLFFQLLISAMLFNSGGHSLNEFTAPFLIPEVVEAFKSIPHYETCFHLDYMYLETNKEAFEQAIHDTIIYNQMILLRKKVQLEITTSPDASKTLMNLKEMLKEFSEIRQSILIEKERIQTDYQASYFTFFNNKGSKNILLQAGLSTLLNNMEQENLPESLVSIKKLKEQYEGRFGKKTFLGYEDEMFHFLEVLEEKLLSLNEKLTHSPKHK